MFYVFLNWESFFFFGFFLFRSFSAEHEKKYGKRNVIFSGEGFGANGLGGIENDMIRKLTAFCERTFDVIWFLIQIIHHKIHLFLLTTKFTSLQWCNFISNQSHLVHHSKIHLTSFVLRSNTIHRREGNKVYSIFSANRPRGIKTAISLKTSPPKSDGKTFRLYLIFSVGKGKRAKTFPLSSCKKWF